MNFTMKKEDRDALEAAGDFSGYKALGYSDQDVSNLKAAYDRTQALNQAAAQKGSGSGSGSSGNQTTGVQTGGGYQEGDYDALFQAASRSQSPANFIAANYQKFGFDKSTGLSSAYNGWANAGGASPSFDYDPDEGIFTLNGQRYTTRRELEEAINGLNLTDGQRSALERKLRASVPGLKLNIRSVG